MVLAGIGVGGGSTGTGGELDPNEDDSSAGLVDTTETQPSDPVESQEDDVVTYEDVASPDELDNPANIAAASDDQNLNDTVDATTTATTDSGQTVTNVSGGDEAEWAAVPDVGVDADETGNDSPDGDPAEVNNGLTAGESIENWIEDATENESESESSSSSGLGLGLGDLSRTQKLAGGATAVVVVFAASGEL